MCGIAGIVSPAITQEAREAAVNRMVRRQRHRGPDSDGIFSDGPATIGMCRLAIFDPKNGRQPMSTPDGRFHIVFNGAIYNFKALRQDLESLGWGFRTNCDTEVLLAAYAQWREASLQKLRGMFAFALWDNREKSLFIARDPLGIKPLYYCRLPDDTFGFASEINALLASGIVAREIDPVAVGDYLAWFAVPAPRTIFRRISNLPPGHCLMLNADGRCVVRSWWRLPEATRNPPSESYREFVQVLRERLVDSIQAHRLADVPVGAFLSGGLDSSSIVGLMTRESGERIKTFSLVFDQAEYSEEKSARLAADASNSEHFEFRLTGREVADCLPTIMRSFDQPTGDGVNTYFISKAAKDSGVRVVLSGLGGDELFGGYESFYDMPRIARWIPVWRQLPRTLRGRVLGMLRARGSRDRKMADFLEYARDLHELCSLRRRVLSETARLELLAPDARRLAKRQGPNHPMLDDFVFELLKADSTQVVGAWEMRTYMADVLLRDSDVFAMSHSLELRVPFVDRQLVEWWWNQPLEYRFNPSRPKGVLADAVENVVPAAIRSRKKQGFTLPFSVWMGTELKPFLEETFSASSIGGCPWLDSDAVSREWARWKSTSDKQSWSRLWTLAVLVAFANRKDFD